MKTTGTESRKSNFSIGRILRSLGAFCLAVSMIVPTLPVVAAQGYRMDNNHWAQSYVNNLFQYGLMRGDQDGNMEPDRNITRAEFVSILNRAFGYSERGKNPFRDVKGTEWYADDLKIAFTQGYFQGSDKSQAEPNANLTREQAVSLICRNLKIEGVSGENFQFADSRSFNDWSRDYINASSEKGYVRGYQDRTFRPTQSITRGEAAKIISDAVGTLVSQPGNQSLGYVSGNVTVAASGVNLYDTTIRGDLFLTEGIGLGFTNFENVKVEGEVIIGGAGNSNAGRSSVIFDNSTIRKLTVDTKQDAVLSLKINGTTTIDKTYIKSDAYLEELSDWSGGFTEVHLVQDDVQLDISGSFQTVKMFGEKSKLTLAKGSISTLIVDEVAKDATIKMDKGTYVGTADLDTGVTIQGTGEIGTLTVSAPDVKVDSIPDTIIIRPGLTATIGGKKMDSLLADQTSEAPKISASYPKVEDIEPTAANLLLKTNKPGTLYWAVTTDDAPVLTAEEVIKQNKTVSKMEKNGKLTVVADEEKTIKLSGLKSDVRYDVYAVLVDEKGQESAKKTESFRTADNIPPNFVSGYPKVNSYNQSNDASIDIITTKDCKIYWALYTDKATAPKLEELVGEKTAGSIKTGVLTGLKTNVNKPLVITGLSEAQNYTVYLAASDGSNYSKLVTLKLATVDKTPPAFLSGYPKLDKITTNSVAVKFQTNEAATVYYVAMQKGATFPPGATTKDLTSQAAKDAVLTGNNAFKAGKGTSALGKEGIVTISGLAPQMPYDLYLVAQDKDKNTSVVSELTVKTTDTVKPTVTQAFDEVVNNNPVAEAEIKLLFSEIVCETATSKPLKDLDVKSVIGNQIVLYDVSVAKRVAVTPKDWSKIKIEEVDAKTIVTFSRGSLPLASGSKYQFELNEIVDTSGNRMNNKTLLPIFQTVSPMVTLAKTIAPESMHLTFLMTPQSVQTSDDVMFDMLLTSNTDVTFALYSRDSSDPNASFARIPKKGGGIAPELTLLKDEKYSLNGLIYGSNYQFDKFNSLPQSSSLEYGIAFTKINGKAKTGTESPWGETVTLNIQCVSGSHTDLRNLAANPKGNLDPLVRDGSVSLVHTPSDFRLSISFTDTVMPQFTDGYPQFTAGDTTVIMRSQTDKQATLYYIIAPKDTIKQATSLDVMRGTIVPSGGKFGSFSIKNGYVMDEFEIVGLKPETSYDIFYVLKGSQPEPSGLYTFKDLKTTEANPPKFTQKPPVQVSGRTATSATIATTVDTNAIIYWVVYPSTLDPKLVTTEVIMNQVERTGDLKPASAGSTQAKANTPVSITVSPLERDVYYTFYAVAKNQVGTSVSDIVKHEQLTPADVTPPYIVEALTQADYKLMITFSEPVYYRPSDTATNSVPLNTEAAWRQNLFPSNIIKSVLVSGSGSAVLIEFQEGQKENAALRFEGIIFDANNNRAGRFSAVLTKKADDSLSWDVTLGN